MKKQKLMWWEINETIESLANEIKEKQKISSIVAIARGGVVPARYLAKLLDVRRMYSLGMEFYYDSSSPDVEIDAKMKTPRIYQDLTTNFADTDTVLIVDDVVDSGESMRMATEVVKSKGAGKILTCSLHYKTNPKFSPDFYGKIIPEHLWLVYDWE